MLATRRQSTRAKFRSTPSARKTSTVRMADAAATVDTTAMVDAEEALSHADQLVQMALAAEVIENHAVMAIERIALVAREEEDHADLDLRALQRRPKTEAQEVRTNVDQAET